MPKHLFLSLTACCLLAACADHSGDVVVTQDLPPSPINNPDAGAANPVTETQPGPGDTPSGGSGGVPVGTGGSGGPAGTLGDQTRPNQGYEGGGPPPGGGGEGGQPVPEPSTLLLVGTGLAGAALLRRRRQKGPAA